MEPPRYFTFLFWTTLALSLLLHLSLCDFFTLGDYMPFSNDINPCNLWKYHYQFPPRDQFLSLNWLGLPLPAPALNFFTLVGDLPPWLFFTCYPGLCAALAIAAMVLLVRELGLSPLAALFAGVTLGWQGDLVSFVYPGHFAYMAFWATLSLGVWAILRSLRTGYWPYTILSGLCCGWIVQSIPDRGYIASLFIAALYLFGTTRARAKGVKLPKGLLNPFLQLPICTAIAVIVAIASLLSVAATFVEGVSLGEEKQSADQAFALATQFRLGPPETLTLAVPGFFGWISKSGLEVVTGSRELQPALYWGENGRMERGPNFNTAISTVGTISSEFALLGIFVLLLGPVLGITKLAKGALSARQLEWGRFFVAAAFVTLILSWGANTPLYRLIYHLPGMDKWRNPLKWLEITTFCLAILSGYGLHLVLHSFRLHGLRIRAMRRFLRSFLASLSGLLLIGLIADYPYGDSLAVYNPDGGVRPYLFTHFGFQPNEVADVLAGMHYALIYALFLSLITWGAVEMLWFPKWFREREWSANPLIQEAWVKILSPACIPYTYTVLMIAMAVGQLYWVTGHFIVPFRYSDLTGSNAFLDELSKRGPLARISVQRDDFLIHRYLQFQFNKYKIPVFEIQAASRIPNAFQDFQKALTLNLAQYYSLSGVTTLAVSANDIQSLRLDPAFARNFAGPPQGFNLRYAGPDAPSHAIIDLKHFFYKATFIPHAEFLPDQASLISRMSEPYWNPQDVISFNKQDADSPTADEAPKPDPADTSSNPLATVIEYTPLSMTIRVDQAKPGFILINDSFHPGWHATIDGKPVPIYRGDIYLRAIPISAKAPVVTISLNFSPEYPAQTVHPTASFTSYLPRISSLAANIFSDSASVILTILCIVALRNRREDLLLTKRA